MLSPRQLSHIEFQNTVSSGSVKRIGYIGNAVDGGWIDMHASSTGVSTNNALGYRCNKRIVADTGMSVGSTNNNGTLDINGTIGFSYTSNPSLTTSHLGYYSVRPLTVQTIPVGAPFLKSWYSFTIPARGVWLISWAIGFTNCVGGAITESFIATSSASYVRQVGANILGSTVAGGFYSATNTAVYENTGSSSVTFYITHGVNGLPTLNNGYVTIARIG